MNWLGVFQKVSANVEFYFKPRVVIAMIPKYALENHYKILRVSEDDYNVFITFEKCDNKNVAVS
jgi:hypothetical protein